MMDIFAGVKERTRVFKEAIAKAPVVDVYGVVEASGVVGSQMKGEPWEVGFSLSMWRTGDGEGALCRDKIPVSKEVEEGEIAGWRERIRPYDVVHLRGRIARHPLGHEAMVMEELVTASFADAVLRLNGSPNS